MASLSFSLFGISLILINGTSINPSLWVQAKLFLVVILTIYHLFLGYYLRKFALDENKKSAKFFRIINEIPTALLILIIFVIIYKNRLSGLFKAIIVTGFLLILQIVLGILTLLYSAQVIIASMHQISSILLVSSSIYFLYLNNNSS